jgi:hypothetical protein
MKNDHPTFEQLCHAVLEGSASEADLEQFRERLHSNAADRDAHLETRARRRAGITRLGPDGLSISTQYHPVSVE